MAATLATSKMIELTKNSDGFKKVKILYESQKEKSVLKPSIESLESTVVGALTPVVVKVKEVAPGLLAKADARVADAVALYDARAPDRVKTLVSALMPRVVALAHDPAAAYNEALRQLVTVKDALVSAISEALEQMPETAGAAAVKVRDFLKFQFSAENAGAAYAILAEAIAQQWAMLKENFPDVCNALDQAFCDFLDTVHKVTSFQSSPSYAALHAKAVTLVAKATESPPVVGVLSRPSVQMQVAKVSPFLSPVLERLAPVASAA